jgi:hypothetical protein
VGEKTALAEADGGRKTRDREAFYSFDRHEACRLAEDRVPVSCFGR